MTSAIDSHLRDLENELRDADRDVEECRERSQRRIDAMNTEIAELVKKVQFEKAAIKEQLDRKELWAKRKFDDLHAFKVSRFLECHRLGSNPSGNSLQQLDSWPDFCVLCLPILLTTLYPL